MKEKKIVVPELSIGIIIKDKMSKEEIVVKIEQALGLSFLPDWEGDFEEANALVAEAFGTTFALYEELTGFVLITDPCSLYEQKAESVWVIADHFIGELLRRKAGLSYGAREIAPRVWVRLHGTARVVTCHALPQVTARIGAALGARLGHPFQRFRTHTPPFAEMECGFVGHLLGHRIEVYAQGSPTRPGRPRPIIVEVTPEEPFSPDGAWDVAELPISEFLAVWLEKETDLPFTPHEAPSESPHP